MSSEVEPRPTLLENLLAGRLDARIIGLVSVVVVASVVAPLAILLILTPPQPPPHTAGTQDDPLALVRSDWSHDTDHITLQNGVQRLNAYYNQNSKDRPLALEHDKGERLRAALKLDADELAEIDSTSHTGLDTNFLEACFLLRDAARGLGSDVTTAAANDPSVQLTPLDQAVAAFNWVVRQVRLEDQSSRIAPPQIINKITPPLYVLRRNQGTALERGLVFLDLLRQLDPDNEQGAAMIGCLFLEPASGDRLPRVFAVGVLIDKDIYLFDPGLGLPIPAADGKGVATLANALTEPQVLKQLTVNEKMPYDVTAQKLRDAEVCSYFQMSALAPRMAQLQKNVLSPYISVGLSADFFAEQATLESAVAAARGTPAAVSAFPQGLRVLRSFLPPEEGGVDKPFGMQMAFLRGMAAPADQMEAVGMERKKYAELELVPWTGLPDPFRQFPHRTSLGTFIREQYAKPFRESALEPKGPRDLILRGHYHDAIDSLIPERDTLANDNRQLQRAIQAAGGEDKFYLQVYQYLNDKALPAAANLQRAKDSGDTSAFQAAGENMLKVWHSDDKLIILLNGRIASTRRPDVTYLLGLAKQERAEALQLRLEASQRRNAPAKDDAARAATAWRGAEDWWLRYTDEYPNGTAATAVRRQRGRVLTMIGDQQAAIATLENIADIPETLQTPKRPMPYLEKVGNLYLASKLTSKLR